MAIGNVPLGRRTLIEALACWRFDDWGRAGGPTPGTAGPCPPRLPNGSLYRKDSHSGGLAMERYGVQRPRRFNAMRRAGR